MSSALKPVLTASGPQNAAVPPQMNKPMHPQNMNSTYGQPSTHVSQNLVNLPLNNPNAAHNNPAHTNTHLASAHQPNHYSLNVPNAPQHYMSNQSIPISNHPVPNISQSQVGSQSQAFGAPQKNTVFGGNYQPNLGHPPNALPQTQNVPVTQSQQTTSPTESVQSNGTPEVKSPAKSVTETQQNYTTVSKVPSPSPAPPPQPPSSLTSEKAKASTPEKPPVLPQVISDPKPAPEIKAVEASSTSSVPKVTSTSKSSSVEVTTTAVIPPASVTGESRDEKKTEPASSASAPNSAVESTTTSQETPQIPEDSNSSTGSENTSSVTNSQKASEQPSTQKTSQPKATQRTPTKRSKAPKPDSDSPKNAKSEVKAGPAQKSPGSLSKSKRTRTRTQPYQSPLPELEIISKMTSTASPKSRGGDDKLIIFYKNEFLAVRNSEGSFYVCQAVQNIYKSSPKIKIRWLSQDKNEKSGEIYTPDFYDNTDFDCILTNLNLIRVDKGKFRLPPHEKERTDSILKRALAVEKGDATPPSLTEEHPDGLDLSLYKEESQLKKRKGKKRKASASLKSKTKATVSEKKSPEQTKVRKVEPKKSVKKPVVKKAVVKKPVTKKLPVKKRVQVKKPPAPVEQKKIVAAASSSSGRAERAKRRSAENTGSTKTSPVVDQKKAKLIAKVARKTVVATPKTRPSRRKH